IILTGRHPLRIVPQPAVGSRVPVRIENPTAAPFSGRVRLAGVGSGDVSLSMEFRQGQRDQTVSLPVKLRPDGSYTVGVRIETRTGNSPSVKRWTTVNASPEVEITPLAGFAAYLSGSAQPANTYRVVP